MNSLRELMKRHTQHWYRGKDPRTVGKAPRAAGKLVRELKSRLLNYFFAIEELLSSPRQH